MKDFLFDFKKVQVHYPEDSVPESFEEIGVILNDNVYVDLTIATDFLNINEILVEKVFIGFTKNYENFELLFFFDIRDLKHLNIKEAFGELIYWTDFFTTKYSFNHYVCQMDNGNKNEYYFDINGLGPLYKEAIADFEANL
ncbi:hypothetical protein [Pedobacter sp. MR2016-24]|uniref:hypothetical protein n=1 Tax=Pedobacter sp. MR2016-24 TaxID=2994466 RepID=UPI0022472DAB|nr:hypothetical protein [Pedobacter sp. MR2016-24]MCX2481991.1 hypothetical protein [Pedobacter sp. MR2016-24]